ncbi:hypothetical protein EJB05_43474, partial [Eragrostis curvula]
MIHSHTAGATTRVCFFQEQDGRGVPERGERRPRRGGDLLRHHPVAVRDVVDHLHLRRRRRRGEEEAAAAAGRQPRQPRVRRRVGALRRHRTRMQRRLRALRHLPGLALLPPF